MNSVELSKESSSAIDSFSLTEESDALKKK